MNNFSVKNINFVGAGASLLAFIFTFLPFYKLSPTSVALLAGSEVSAYQIKKNLVSYNFFGVICLILAIAAIALYVLNCSQVIKLAAIGVSVLDFISLFLALIVGNSDIKDMKSMIDIYFSAYSSYIDSSSLFKGSVCAGFVLELIVIIIMIASYWINEIAVKPLLGDKSGARLNPLEGVPGFDFSKPSYGQPQQFAQGQPQQYGQPQQFAQGQPQQYGQPQQPYAQAPQQPFAQPQQPVQQQYTQQNQPNQNNQ